MLSDSSNKQSMKVPLLQRSDEKTNFKPYVFPGERWKIQPKTFRGELTPLLAIDCEMVGIGMNGRQSIVARVSIVNSLGECVYDKYVKPKSPVTDYRTKYSGIRQSDLENATDFHIVQSEVKAILKGKTLVGHSLRKDLKVLKLKHRLMRDTSKFSKFQVPDKSTPSLKEITERFLDLNIQTDEHDSVEDARAAMQLYMTVEKEWEEEIRERKSKKTKKKNQEKILSKNQLPK